MFETYGDHIQSYGNFGSSGSRNSVSLTHFWDGNCSQLDDVNSLVKWYLWISQMTFA